jgi:hypothetical protein
MKYCAKIFYEAQLTTQNQRGDCHDRRKKGMHHITAGMEITGLIHADDGGAGLQHRGTVTGARAVDHMTGKSFEVRPKVIRQCSFTDDMPGD